MLLTTRLQVAEGGAVVDLQEAELAAASLPAGFHPPAHAQLVADLQSIIVMAGKAFGSFVSRMHSDEASGRQQSPTNALLGCTHGGLLEDTDEAQLYTSVSQARDSFLRHIL